MTEALTLSAPAATRQSLFRGLNYYTEAEADVFFGRAKETQQLYQLVNYNVLTLVFGKSGTGKTSLLNAGVFPLLREDDCLPFPIRLKFGQDSPSLKEQVVQVLTNKIEQDGFFINYFTPDDTLWEFFHREDLWKVITPVLVFDQFEEIFTLLAAQSAKTTELTALFTELADLIENTIPEQIKAAYLQNNEPIPFNYKRQRAKVVFSFREDFLPEMESITSVIPSVKNSRFRLLPMTARQAYVVITKTWKSTIQAAQAREVVYYLTNNAGTSQEELPFQMDTMALFEIEPSLLSQVCSYLEAKRAEENLSEISAEFLQKYPKETILRSIYYNALQDAGNSANSIADAATVKSVQAFLEDNLINEQGYRIKYDRKEISPALLPGISLLKKHYFIREEEDSIELSHDVVANIVKADRDDRRRTIAEREAKAKAKKRAKTIFIGAGIVVLIAAIAAAFFTRKATNAKHEADYWVHVSDSLKKSNNSKGITDTSNLVINRLKRQYQDLTNQYNSLTEQYDNLFRQTDSLNRRNDSLSNSLKESQTEMENSKRDMATYADELGSVKSKLSQVQARLNQFYGKEGDLTHKKNLFDSYKTHIDAIFRSGEGKDKKDTMELYYHVGVFRKNYSGFDRKLNR